MAARQQLNTSRKGQVRPLITISQKKNFRALPRTRERDKTEKYEILMHPAERIKRGESFRDLYRDHI